jgi:hypothetical protein
LVGLFSLAATPEPEHHGALLRALTLQRADQRVLAVVDESGFRRRFHDPSLAARLDERRRAWRTLLDDEGAPPVFVDLDRATAGADAVTPRVGADARPATGA